METKKSTIYSYIFFGNQLVPISDQKHAFLSVFHSKNRRIAEYAYECEFKGEDFKRNIEDYELKELWDERKEIDVLIDINYGTYNYK